MAPRPLQLDPELVHALKVSDAHLGQSGGLVRRPGSKIVARRLNDKSGLTTCTWWRENAPCPPLACFRVASSAPRLRRCDEIGHARSRRSIAADEPKKHWPCAGSKDATVDVWVRAFGQEASQSRPGRGIRDRDDERGSGLRGNRSSSCKVPRWSSATIHRKVPKSTGAHGGWASSPLWKAPSATHRQLTWLCRASTRGHGEVADPLDACWASGAQTWTSNQPART